ncbi:unnamed protein product [Ceratitis capitata]|uniref:(Mediterranean fruit fly) hypothetical protein n=1 Tax=Ceratitis capitata TaxID=7213 RepID=A0A811U3D9_CERCA|nr:unnamed protein product [Ceratitis capitata]
MALSALPTTNNQRQAIQTPIGKYSTIRAVSHHNPPPPLLTAVSSSSIRSIGISGSVFFVVVCCAESCGAASGRTRKHENYPSSTLKTGQTQNWIKPGCEPQNTTKPIYVCLYMVYMYINMCV